MKEYYVVMNVCTKKRTAQERVKQQREKDKNLFKSICTTAYMGVLCAITLFV